MSTFPVARPDRKAFCRVSCYCRKRSRTRNKNSEWKSPAIDSLTPERSTGKAMEESTVLQKIRDRFSDTVIELHSRLGEDTAVISKKALLDVARFLKEDPELRFNYLMDVTAVDYWKRKPRFEVVYHFLSLSTRQRLRLKVPVGEQNPEVDSLTGLWRSADWYEREVYDMYGIKFRNHPNLTRILMYAEFEGHPLRKDYPITRRQPLIGPRD